ncbi:hypothetical protein FHS43_006077 [Streptosporangium becharense]|uniref:DUF3263 domain-containing protein n=1 Tax=Streptosporangium becharense TaxID=1816182 RepID=A0A7W9IHG1_9ACTN|nr:DUF3263 domain-containing protein [Streptosporangium becharense]MBB2914765.1 hypothetical protein [Streptosporangium becharense]MBB5820834.1 hypothetical protein [Streptosporangium becharense]
MDAAPTPDDDAGSGEGAGRGAGDGRDPVSRELTDAERELLAFERRWWRYPGAKEQAIRETFGISATRYYQLLGEVIDLPGALAHDPMLVKRLRRLREMRRRARAARRTGFRQ